MFISTAGAGLTAWLAQLVSKIENVINIAGINSFFSCIEHFSFGLF
jgi:hypothetical protein